MQNSDIRNGKLNAETPQYLRVNQKMHLKDCQTCWECYKPNPKYGFFQCTHSKSLPLLRTSFSSTWGLLSQYSHSRRGLQTEKGDQRGSEWCQFLRQSPWMQQSDHKGEAREPVSFRVVPIRAGGLDSQAPPTNLPVTSWENSKGLQMICSRSPWGNPCEAAQGLNLRSKDIWRL